MAGAGLRAPAGARRRARRNRAPARPSWVQDWEDFRRTSGLSARMQEVFAGFVTHTDHHLGRLFDGLARLRRSRQHDRPAHVGQRCERRRRHDWVGQRAPVRVRHGDDLERQPRRRRRARRLSGVQPLPLGLGVGGQHAVPAVEALHLAGWNPHPADRPLARRDRRPRRGALTVLPHRRRLPDCARRLRRRCARGRRRSGPTARRRRSLRATFADAGGRGIRTTQYFEMLGSRSIFHDGWKATTDHVSKGVLDEDLLEGSRDFDEDRWACSDSTTTSPRPPTSPTDHPDVVRTLEARWWTEAEHNHVLPLVDGLLSRLARRSRWPNAPRTCVFRPEGEPVRRRGRAISRGGRAGGRRRRARGWRRRRPSAMGDWTRRALAFFVRDGRLNFVINAAATCPASRPTDARPVWSVRLGCNARVRTAPASR